jgi:hypothetical protein
MVLFDDEPPPRRVNSGRPSGKKRFATKGEREDAIRQVSRLLKPHVQPSSVVRFIIDTWGISDRAAYDLLRDARSYLCARWGMGKDYLRCELVDFVSTLTGDRTASVSEKIAAVNTMAKMLDLFAADKSVVTNVAADPEAARNLLQQMHADLLNNPEACEHAHALYEALGSKSDLPTLSLEERMARNQREAAELLAEFSRREGRLQNGLKELPNGDPH